MSARGGGGGGGMTDDDAAALLDPQDDNPDDDNAAVDAEALVDKEDPLLLAIDDLEGRVVAALDDVKLHPGVRTAAGGAAASVHEELATLLRPVLEVAAHTAPSIARTYYQGIGLEGIEVSVEDVYERVVSDLVLPVMLEMAQSDPSPAKRGASLEFFRMLWKESTKAGSWLDESTTGIQAGPYGPGGSGGPAAPSTPVIVAALKRRQVKRLAREGEILRYWIEASIACLQPGVFSNEESEGTVASRGIIAASASLRPSLAHIALRIKDADDRGATRLYTPVMKMVEAVLKKLFLGSPVESILSACIKFLEILILCCSFKVQDVAALRRRGQTTAGLFSLDDLPAGHPIITRESMESIAEYAFTTLRGFTILGGQIKIDVNLLSDMMLTTGSDSSPSSQVVSILKPAALAYLEIESTLPKLDEKDALHSKLDHANFEFDFLLGQKSYVLTVNAMAALAINRPTFFKESSLCLARKVVSPPVFSDNGPLTKIAVLAVTQALKASCLTLLRNSLSVTTHASESLHDALQTCDMEAQADKALDMARQADALKNAGRAARNRASMYYEWEEDEGSRQSKRQKETDDALAQMRAAKAARGLGHGIQLPTSMTDAIELVLLNMENLPTKRPARSTKEKSRKVQMTLDFVLDAILTNGSSLVQEEGKWYERDGGESFSIDLESKQKLRLSSQFQQILENIQNEQKGDAIEDQQRLFFLQSNRAAAAALSRIISIPFHHRPSGLADISKTISARLVFALKRVPPDEALQSSLQLAHESLNDVKKLLGEVESEIVANFIEAYPLAASGLALEASRCPEGDAIDSAASSFATRILNEAFLQSTTTDEEVNIADLYNLSLEVYIASVVAAGRSTDEKPNDVEKRRVAVRSAVELHRDLSKLPRLTPRSLLLVGGLCDVGDIFKKAAEISRKSSHEPIASSAAVHAAKVAAEKRATTALLIYRDIAIQKDDLTTRKAAVDSAAAVASGRLPSIHNVQENALKLLINVLYTRNDELSELVVEAATFELRFFSDVAVSSFESIQKANESSEKDEKQKISPLSPQSEEEKQLLSRLKPATLLFMAICVRKPDLIKTLFEICSAQDADVLSKSVRSNMSTLSWACALKHGAAPLALKVAAMSGSAETPVLLSFLENLAPAAGKLGVEDELAEACYQIQESKTNEKGERDPRYIIPIVSVMKRQALVQRLPEFVTAEDNVFLAALVRMCDRQQRNALLFRDEPDESKPSLRGMTYCEQLVYLHHLDFATANITQKRYLSVIKLCLDDEEVFTDRVTMAALEYMSGRFLSGAEGLPLAFMRTVILTCTKHESLQSWIANILLTRLVEGKIYDDPRQWEGWMRCAHMLEKSAGSTASSIEAIDKLPNDQLEQYRRKWAGTNNNNM